MVTDDNGDFIIDIEIFQIISELKFNAKNKIPAIFFSKPLILSLLFSKLTFVNKATLFKEFWRLLVQKFFFASVILAFFETFRL